MPSFKALIRFEADDGQIYFADLGESHIVIPKKGATLDGYSSFEDLELKQNPKSVNFTKLLAPVTHPENSIYCVGLNYKSHATEAGLKIPQHPPLWTKPAASLANPDEEIVLSKFCAENLPDYEAELVFITSRECRDLSVSEAPDYILGYTLGNDLSCRMFQMPDNMGGQFFYAKAFDRFAPLGPVLVHPDLVGGVEGLMAKSEGEDQKSGHRITCKLDGEDKPRQDAVLGEDMIWGPAEVLSWMSQSTTIPAGTVVMTGTTAGVGVFQSPRRLLRHEDVVEVEIPAIGKLRNKIVFAESQEGKKQNSTSRGSTFL